jgi:hypothetical protein
MWPASLENAAPQLALEGTFAVLEAPPDTQCRKSTDGEAPGDTQRPLPLLTSPTEQCGLEPDSGEVEPVT